MCFKGVFITDKQQYIILSDDTDEKVQIPKLSEEDEKNIDNIIKKVIKESALK